MTYISAILTDDRKRVKVWKRVNGKRVVKNYDAPYYFYIPDPHGTYKDLYGNTLSRLDFSTSYEFHEAKKSYAQQKIRLFESDIAPDYKVLSENYYGTDINALNVTFFDIEVDYDRDRGFSSVDNPYAPINSIAIYHQHTDRTVVLAVPPETRPGYTYDDLPDDIKNDAEVVICSNEKELLELFFEEIEESDIISGWNSDFFDVPYVYERANMVLHKKAGHMLCFEHARDPYYKEFEKFGNINKKLCISGRVSLDYLEVYKKFEVSEKPSYKLEHVSEEELPHLPKISYDGSLYELYREDFEEFIRYNIRDTVILKALEEKKKYIQLAVQMSHMATAKTEDVLGTIKVAEMSMVNYCHYDLGVKVPDTVVDETLTGKYEGAVVLEPKVGMHSWIGSLDLASLYPTTMRSLNMSPETIVGQFAERQEAYEAIRERHKQKRLNFIMESTGEVVTATADKWAKALPKKGWCLSALGTVFHQKTDGVIPSILTTWFAERKKYKKMMNEAKERGDSAEAEYYDRMQFIKKIQLNSMYGACGNKYFKFYDVRLAASTTLTGREVLYHMGSKVAEILDGKYSIDSDCIVYGDTDSVYFLTYEDNKDDALRVSNELCDAVNESYPTFMEEAFFCDEAHKGLQKAEQEIISDNGIFIKKKYYILHLVADDGRDSDKIKDMGVPIKKTTLPKDIKNQLRAFIERLLKGESWDIIGPDVVYFKDELRETDDVLRLGLPKGIKGVEAYTEKFNAKEPDLRLPGHVAAAILWNKCLKTYGDTESPKIISGSKISTFYLTRKIDVFKSIAVPKDLNVLPDWFNEHFLPLIDRNAQIERLVDKPMEIMISAADIKVPSKKKLLLEEALFG